MANRSYISLRIVILSTFLLSSPGCAKAPASSSSLSFKTIANPENVHPVVILGGGIAGFYAATYTGMAGYPATVITGKR